MNSDTEARLALRWRAWTTGTNRRAVVDSEIRNELFTLLREVNDAETMKDSQLRDCIDELEEALAAVPTEQPAAGDDLQHEIATWARDTFGAETGQVLTKMDAEYRELQEAAGNACAWDEVADPEDEHEAVAKESADVLFMLFQLAANLGFDLLDETRKKFEVNRARRWERQPDGTYQHVKESEHD